MVLPSWFPSRASLVSDASHIVSGCKSEQTQTSFTTLFSFKLFHVFEVFFLKGDLEVVLA